jgi:hypothetical protein
MTEKRFVAIGVEWTDGFIQDHIGDRDLFNIGAVCKFLNELSEENEQLKKDGLYWSQNAEARLKEIDKLRKDNSILKQQRDYLFDVIDAVLPHSGSTTAYNRMQDIGDDGND